MLTWKYGHSYVREEGRVVDFEEVFRMRADLRSTEKLDPTGFQFQRRNFLKRRRAERRRETRFSNRPQSEGRRRKTTNLFAQNRMDSDSCWEVTDEMVCIDVQLVDGTLESSGGRSYRRVSSGSSTLLLFPPSLNSQLDDDRIRMPRSSRPLGMPTILHRLSSSREE